MTPETGSVPTGTVPVSAAALRLAIPNPSATFATVMLAKGVTRLAVLITPAMFKLL